MEGEGVKIHNCLQGSEEWLNIRRGLPTASKFREIITSARGDLSKSAPGYMAELLAETYDTDLVNTDVDMTGFEGNRWTDRGTALEPDARAKFEEITGYTVKEVGFVTRDAEDAGCSPDGLAYEGEVCDGGLEIKCPAPKTHVLYIEKGELPGSYKQQVHGSMAITGLNVWYFMSYCPGIQPLLLEVKRSAYTDAVERALNGFVADYAKYKAKMSPRLNPSARGALLPDAATQSPW